MPHPACFLPADLQIVSERDLWLFQRRRRPTWSECRAVQAPRSAPDEDLLAFVADELDRREFLRAAPRPPRTG